MARIIYHPQDMRSDLSTVLLLKKIDANQLPSDYFSPVRKNIPQGMGILNSYGEEIPLGRNPSHGDTQRLVLSSGDNDSGGEATDRDIEVVQKREKNSKEESFFD